MDAHVTGETNLSRLVTAYNLNISSHLTSLWRSCSDKVIVLFCVFRYCTWTETTSSETVRGISVCHRKLHTFLLRPPPTPTHSQTHHSNMFIPSTPGYSRSEYSIPCQECFEIDPTDSTQVVKMSPVSEAGPAHPMEQVNPQHLGTCVHYTCRQASQPSTTAQAVSTHNIVQMESKVNRHKTKSSPVCHVICVHT